MILLTGFEPFTTGEGLILTHNPTADIVVRVAQKLPHARHAVLPVSFQATRRALVEQFEAHRPRIWIGLGYAPHRTTLDIETLAVNMEHATRADNDGERPWMREIISGAPPAYRTRLDVEHALRVLEQNGVQAVPCFHAGTFLCNQTFYLGCHRCETLDELDLAAFIHVPPMDDYAALEGGLLGLISALSHSAPSP